MHLLCSYTLETFAKELSDLGEPSFVAKQIMDWVYEKNVSSWDAMTNISAQRRKLFAERWLYPALKLVSVLPSDNAETYKFVWEPQDRKNVESTLSLADDRRTVTVSTQIGPGKRNLSLREIVEQIVHIKRWLAERGDTITHVVYKGESLKNYDAVVGSVLVLSHPKMLNFSQKRMTLSTVGIVEGIKRLSHEGVKVNLTLSLHAPNQFIRRKIIPNAKKNPLAEIVAAMDEYANATKGNIIFDYALIRGLKDSPDQAFELANLLKKKQGTVHLIPYTNYSDKKAVKDFRSVLFGAGISNTYG